MTVLAFLILFGLGAVGWLGFLVMEGVYMDERVARKIAEGRLRAVLSTQAEDNYYAWEKNR